MEFKKRRRQKPEIPLSSTADVAFLLLVFFIATTVFGIEEGLPLILPPKGAQTVKVSIKNVARIVAYENGAITIDNQPIAPDDIKEAVEARLFQNDKLVISLETDPRCRYEVMVKILDQLKLAQATRISLRLYQPTQ